MRQIKSTKVIIAIIFVVVIAGAWFFLPKNITSHTDKTPVSAGETKKTPTVAKTKAAIEPTAVQVVETPAETEAKLQRAKQRKELHEQIIAIKKQIQDVDNQILQFKVETANKLGLELSEKNIRGSRYNTDGSEEDEEVENTKEQEMAYSELMEALDSITDYPEYFDLKQQKKDLQETIMALFTNDTVKELEAQLEEIRLQEAQIEQKQDDIRISILQSLNSKFLPTELEKVKAARYAHGKLSREESKYKKLASALDDQLRRNADYKKLNSESSDLYGQSKDIIKKIRDEREKQRIRSATEEFDDTGKVPFYIRRSERSDILSYSKLYNDNKPSFNLFLDFGQEQFIAKNSNLYKIVNGKEVQVTNNTSEYEFFDIDTNIYYSALFDRDNQIIYILQSTVLEAVDKRINIFTVDLKTGKIYNFDDHLPFFATYYLYNNQLFATGRGKSGTRETYIINKDTVEKYTGKLDVEFYSIGSYHDVPINHWELNIMFLDVTALNADPTRHAKLIDTKTNKTYSLKCGLMYEQYFWAKNFANVVGNCEIDYEPFGEFGLDWDAFSYGIRGTAKIYSGCDTKTKTILSIDAFCQDVRE